MSERKLFQIFKAGRHTSMLGNEISFSEDDLRLMEAAYNSGRNATAPLVLGHPRQPAETFGEVVKLSRVGEALFALATVADPLIKWVREGRYKKVSASFASPVAIGNPVPGAYMLNHVGFLGATVPAVRGMAQLGFSDTDGFAQPPGVLCFGSAAMPAPLDYGMPFKAPAGYTVSREREAVYHGAGQIWRALPYLSFAEACVHAERIIFST